MNFIIILQEKSKIIFSFLLSFIFLSIINRCQEFLNYIDTYFLIDEKSSTRSELITRVLSIENQLNEYNQIINQEIANVKIF
jgi:hypothetical protein